MPIRSGRTRRRDVAELPLYAMIVADGMGGHAGGEVVDDDAICQVLIAYRESAEACRRLVDLALAGGARDNVTVVVASYTFA